MIIAMSADAVSFESRPALKHPVLVLAFAGWSDAGASASTAVRYLTEQLLAAKFASKDPNLSAFIRELKKREFEQ